MEDQGGEQLSAGFRLRVIGRVSATGGKRFALTQDGFAAALASAGVGLKGKLPERLGEKAAQPVELGFARLKSLTLADVVANVPLLSELKAIADGVGSGSMEIAAARARLEALVGAGPLVDAARAAEPPVATPPQGVETGVFAQADLPKPSSGSALDSFVRATRSAPAKAAAAPASKKLRSSLEEAVYSSAAALLAEPEVARFESVWRGLKLLVDQASKNARTAIDVFDVGIDGVVAALESDIPDDHSERPDVAIVLEPIDDVGVLARLADVAESLSMPVIVSVTPAFFGAAADGLALAVEAPNAAGPEGWAELRAQEASRWLCVTINRVAVVSEGVGAARHAAFTPSSLALAAMLVASYRETRGFARILGGTGALEAPAGHELRGGRHEGVVVPTESFLPLSAQTALAKLGVLGLGSGRDTTKVALSVVPTARHSVDAVPLPAQLLTGKIVRLATWLAGEVPPGSPDGDVVGMFEQAAQVFLFAGMGEGARCKVGVGKDGGRRVVEFFAGLTAELAATPFQIAFTLPIPE